MYLFNALMFKNVFPNSRLSNSILRLLNIIDSPRVGVLLVSSRVKLGS